MKLALKSHIRTWGKSLLDQVWSSHWSTLLSSTGRSRSSSFTRSGRIIEWRFMSWLRSYIWYKRDFSSFFFWSGISLISFRVLRIPSSFGMSLDCPWVLLWLWFFFLGMTIPAIWSTLRGLLQLSPLPLDWRLELSLFATERTGWAFEFLIETKFERLEFCAHLVLPLRRMAVYSVQ